jgi:hypothetical protein
MNFTFLGHIMGMFWVCMWRDHECMGYVMDKKKG